MVDNAFNLAISVGNCTGVARVHPDPLPVLVKDIVPVRVPEMHLAEFILTGIVPVPCWSFRIWCTSPIEELVAIQKHVRVFVTVSVSALRYCICEMALYT